MVCLKKALFNERGELEFRNVRELDIEKLLEGSPDITIGDLLSVADVLECDLGIDLKEKGETK